MPPKKRTGGDPGSGTQQKRRRKKKATNGDAEDDSEEENNGNNSGGEYEEEDGQGDAQVIIEGSKVTGEVLFSGASNWDMVGRSKLPKDAKNGGGPNLWAPHRIASLTGVKVRSIITGCLACHNLIITAEGKVYSWGRNDKGQLGHGDTKRRDIPTIIESLKDENIISAAVGKNHTLILNDRGVVYACGDNKMGQIGIGSQAQSMITTPARIKYKGPPIRRIACGGEFCMISDIRGNLYSFGCPEYGQLGHNTDGKYFVTSNKLSYECELRPRRVHVFIEKSRDGHVSGMSDVEIVDIACGQNHTLALDSKKRVFTWGFGGYGRLGHSEPKDEHVPRHLKWFDTPSKQVVMINCGSTFSIAKTEVEYTYLWGQTKATGEAAMYPKAISDLNGWKVRSVGCSNKSIVVAADESLISWGPSPTYGELCYGENKPKSSTQAQEVKSINTTYILQVACGYGHTLLLARADSEEDTKCLEKIPIFTP
ncbi:unnamed protein product [Owenia fusiformis]|uniref:RCC1-like domain-containing protein n=1 Tax=Owenia fusiformis TaxID=6347 RepID=A0A8J1XYT9_OWEFU|nr:unnamed protein product [Owenia fusiformis]